ncbi:MAG: hypothetical protein R2940_17935 [Syntrophotaleaceae bacterium]
MKTSGISLNNPVVFTLVLTLLASLLAVTGFRHELLHWSKSRRAARPAPAPQPAPPVTVSNKPVVEKSLPEPGPRVIEEKAVPSAPAVAEEPVTLAIPGSPTKYRAGEDPEFARRSGWPVTGPAPLPGAILPHKRIVAFYGNPLSWRMGILGKSPKEEMLRQLQEEMARWRAADPSMDIQPALHLIAVTAQTTPGRAGKYRMIMLDEVVTQVYEWAKEAEALLFIDIQTGHDDIRNLLPRFEWILKNPDVHLGIDPEFNLVKSGAVPGTEIGTFDAADVNYVTGYLRDLVRKHNLPPKVLTVHRFTSNGVTNYRDIELTPEIQIVMHMDGWGGPWLKRDSYKRYVVAEPVQYTGFKLFYHNDTKKGDPLMTPEELLRLQPRPLYIQYQ